MNINIKRENNTTESSLPKPTQLRESTTENITANKYMERCNETEMRSTERVKDVATDVNNSQTDMPVVDLRLVKKENFDGDDEIQAEAATMAFQRNSNFLEQERCRNGRNVDSILHGHPKDSSNIASEENGNGRRPSDDNETFPYRVPIVYPIHSPPIDYQSTSREDRSPSTKDYRLERDQSQSPVEQPRQLYEETNWSTGSPRDIEARFEENSSFPYSSRISSSHKNSTYSLSPRSESREDSCTSPKNITPAHNQRANQSTDDYRVVPTKRRRNLDRFIPADSEKEEESLWKQVQRYRHRKRLPVGKLIATQEETIFMQYNEIRERRHREGRATTTRNSRPSPSNPAKEPSMANSPQDSRQENEAGADAELQSSPQLSPTNENIPEHAPSYVTARTVDLAPKGKGVTYVYVTGPPQASSALPPESTNRELHPVIYDSNHGSTDHIDNQSNKAKHGYHGYIAQDPSRCHGYESRAIEARGRPGVRPGAADCRGFAPYDECYHSNHLNHRTYCSTPRYHPNDSCHGNRKRRMHGCDHYCCNRKRAKPTSSEDDDDDYGVQNDNTCWQISPKERHRGSETRNGDDMYRHENGAQQCSPTSVDSRDNDSVENGPTTQSQVSLENDSHSYTNGHVPKEGSPGRKEGEENIGTQTNPSSVPRGDRQQDDDVVCQVNGLFSLPGYRETKYDITKGELIRRTGLPETLTRVEMISYVRQAKTSGRMLLDTNGITTSNRSHPTILSRVCEREAQVLASGIHKMNLDNLPFKNLVQSCVDMYKSRGCDGCQDCRLKMRRRLVDVEITRNTLREFHHVLQEASANGSLDSFDLASHTFGTPNLLNHLRLMDEYYKQLLIALDKE